VVIDERGKVLQLEGDPRVRRRRSIEEWGSSEGATEEGFRWQKTGEEDAWAMGTNARRSASGRRLRFNGKRRGGGPEG
jgi:hypothetical protein